MTGELSTGTATRHRASRRLVAVALGAAVTLVVAAAPAAAHGVGGRTDLPVPGWQLAWAAGFAVASSFVALGAFWTTPKLVAAATGIELGAPIQKVRRAALPLVRLVVLGVFGVVWYAAAFGNADPAVNIAPTAIFITFWVGMQIVSVVLGDVWDEINPVATLADAAATAWSRVRGRPVPADTGTSYWPAVVAIFSFAWMELAYHGGADPRALAVWLTTYVAVMVGGTLWRGRGWVRRADGFAVLFALLGSLSPLYRKDGRLRVRAPLAGVAAVEARPGTRAFVLTVLGTTTFDGFTRSSIWKDVIANRGGWDATVVKTIGMVAVVLVVSALYQAAMHLVGRVTGESPVMLADRFAPTLVPIVFAYAIAHYFSLFVLEGQAVFILASDPFGRGWDLWGTVDWTVDYRLIATGTIAWIQTVAIAVGHVLGVAAAHDLAVGRYGHRLAVRSQYPMLAVMIAYTVIGLLLLLGV